MSDYVDEIEADKKIVLCGTGYVVRITREMAMMGLDPGDMVRVRLIKISKEKQKEEEKWRSVAHAAARLSGNRGTT